MMPPAVVPSLIGMRGLDKTLNWEPAMVLGIATTMAAMTAQSQTYASSPAQTMG
jgi:hypothetical protein